MIFLDLGKPPPLAGLQVKNVFPRIDVAFQDCVLGLAALVFHVGEGIPAYVLDLVVISERRRGNSMFAEATVKLKIGAEIVHEVAEGAGPVHALDGAFHKALNAHFPSLRDVRLADYKVRILDPDAATGAKTRVLIEAARGEERWSTIGVSHRA